MPAGSAPPMLPPPLPKFQKRRRPNPTLIAAICLAGVALLFVAGMLALRIIAHAGTSEAREAKSEGGLSYTNVRVASEPWSIHVIKIDRSAKDLTFFGAHAKDKVLG